MTGMQREGYRRLVLDLVHVARRRAELDGHVDSVAAQLRRVVGEIVLPAPAARRDDDRPCFAWRVVIAKLKAEG